MTLDDESVSDAIFHPRREDPGYSPQGTRTETVCCGAVVGGYLHVNRASDALLLFFHGNGEVAADYDDLASLFLDCGVSFWAVDYRGYGRGTGAPAFSHMLRDAEALLDDVPRLAQGLGRRFRHILVMGRSLGSAPAIHLAATRAKTQTRRMTDLAEPKSDSLLAGLILDSPFADGLALIRRLDGPSIGREDLPGFEDNLDKMRRCKLPTLILHGTVDYIIPLADAQALYDACAGADKELVKIAGAGHNNLFRVGFDEYTGKLREHISRMTV